MTPWEDPMGIWKTKSQFFTWIRGQVRRSWMHYPISKNFKNSKCRPNEDGGRAKFVGNCARCGCVDAKSHLQVDHIIPAGSINGWESLAEFLQKLFTTSENMRLLCRECHKIITLAERFGCSEDEVEKRILVIEFGKKKPDQQKSILLEHECPADLLGNSETRKTAYANWIKTGSFRTQESGNSDTGGA